MERHTVAVIQATSENGRPARNLANAESLVEDAAGRGAELVVGPEFLATGYVFDESIWSVAERAGGPTEQWLSRLARGHAITIGAGYLEAEGDDFWNTYALFGPDGACLGRVRKASLPFFEGWFFRPDARSKVIATPLGRVGVGICNDAQTKDLLCEFIRERPDLMILPHSAPTPRVPVIDPLFRPLYESRLRSIAGCYARAFDVPVLMANKVSFADESVVNPLFPRLPLRWRFHGYSSIWDGSERCAEITDVELALVAGVHCHRGRRPSPERPDTSYFAFAPMALDAVMGRVMRGFAAAGQRAYRTNPHRAAAARAVRPPSPTFPLP